MGGMDTIRGGFLSAPLPNGGGVPVHVVAEDGFCCSEPQLMLLGNYALYLITCILLWRSRCLRPLKLFTVFLHELGHAVAVWVTCGKVHGIEVNADSGGVTHWSHDAKRIQCVSHLVLPAGYLGSAAWGGVILVCCARPATTHMIAAVLIIFLTIALGYSLLGKSERRGDWTLPSLCIGMLIVLVGMLGMSYSTSWPVWDLVLTKTLLLVGTMNTLFATYDIWDDCIRRSSESSDACRYAELLGLPMATGRCVGIAWFFASFWLAAIALLLALRAAPPGPPVRGIGDLHISSCVFLLLPMFILLGAIADRLPFLKAATVAVAAATGGGSSRVRPWAVVPSIAPKPLHDALLADWRGVDGKLTEHRGGSMESHVALEAAGSADVSLRDWRQGDQEEEALFFMDANEGDEP